MLNISLKSVSKYIDTADYKSYKNLDKRKHARYLPKILVLLFLAFIACMFLPWTQNIRSSGKVTTLNPYDKPQNIQSLIGGRINQWYVKEGDIVAAGDTIMILSEAKAEYLDPDLRSNTKEQQSAKLRSAKAYRTKVQNLTQQAEAIRNLQTSKLDQIKIKQRQLEVEIESVNQQLVAAQTYAENANKQLQRMRTMHEKGIKSLTDLESKVLSAREAEAKLLAVENKLIMIENKKLELLQENQLAISDYEQKKSKIDSEIQSAKSYRFSLLGESNKLQSKYNKLTQRENAYVVTAPINGRITKILKNGIGEFIKAQDDIATIVPMNYQRAVELYIAPVDMPLVQQGKQVRLQFDGWPAIVFSGWPNNSFGTFSGKVQALDNNISDNGKYRILVVESDSEKPWPNLIRIGSGAKGLLLLNDVKVYYELWRQLNGFPPDFYDLDGTKDVKNKAPLRKLK